MKALIITALLLAGCQPANALEQLPPEHVVTLVLLGEARNQTPQGMAAVAQVILNRARERDMSVKAVCLQPSQFSCLNVISRRSEAILAESRAMTIQAQCLAAFICHNVDVMPNFRHNHYHTLNVSPYWSKQGRNKTIIGDHVFMEL